MAHTEIGKALGMLTQAPAVTKFRDRHKHFYVRLAEHASTELRGPDQVAWLAVLEAEHDNLRSAVAWSSERSDAESALRLTGAIWWFWYVRGYWTEGRTFLDAALELAGEASTRLHAKARIGAGTLAGQQVDRDVARAHFEQALELARKLDDAPLVSTALCGIARTHFPNWAEVRVRLEEAISIARACGDERTLADALYALCLGERQFEDQQASPTLVNECLNIARRLRDKRLMTLCLCGFFGGTRFHHDVAGRRAAVAEGLQLAAELRDDVTVAGGLARICRPWQADTPELRASVKNYIEASLQTLRTRGDTAALAGLLGEAAMDALNASEFDVARSRLDELVSLAPSTEPFVLRSLGLCADAEGDPKGAASLWERATELDEGSRAGWSGIDRGRFDAAVGNHHAARPRLERAVEVISKQDFGARSWIVADTVRNLATCTLALGDLATTRTLADQLRQAGESGDPDFLCASLELLAEVACLEGDRAAAHRLGVEAITTARERCTTMELAYALDVFARHLAVAGDVHAATRLLGATEAFRETIRYSYLFPAERRRLQQHVELLRAALPEAEFDELWAEGRAMSIEDTVAYAIAE